MTTPSSSSTTYNPSVITQETPEEAYLSSLEKQVQTESGSIQSIGNMAAFRKESPAMYELTLLSLGQQMCQWSQDYEQNVDSANQNLLETYDQS